MTAEVISYSANPWDVSLSIKVECLKCHVEWGWSYYTESAHRTLQDLANVHNATIHGSRR